MARAQTSLAITVHVSQCSYMIRPTANIITSKRDAITEANEKEQTLLPQIGTQDNHALDKFHALLLSKLVSGYYNADPCCVWKNRGDSQ